MAVVHQSDSGHLGVGRKRQGVEGGGKNADTSWNNNPKKSSWGCQETFACWPVTVAMVDLHLENSAIHHNAERTGLLPDAAHVAIQSLDWRKFQGKNFDTILQVTQCDVLLQIHFDVQSWNKPKALQITIQPVYHHATYWQTAGMACLGSRTLFYLGFVRRRIWASKRHAELVLLCTLLPRSQP